MKSTTVGMLAFLALFVFAFSACGPGGDPQENQTSETDVKDSGQEAWEAARESYHSLMSASFHSAEEDNLEPLKQNYKQMGTAAKDWAKMPVPEEYQRDNIPEALKKLEKESVAIAAVVEQGTEAEMKDAIYALHDVFHKVQELCEDH